LVRELPHRRGNEALGDLERGLDLDTGRGAGIEGRNDPGKKRRDKIDDSYRDEKLGPDRPVIPKLLQHDSIVSHRLFSDLYGGPKPVHVGKGEKAMPNLAIGLPNVPDQYWATV
jgi:hypothetical protein